MIAIAFAILLAQASAADAVTTDGSDLQHTPIITATRGQSPTLRVIARTSEAFAPLVFARVGGTRRFSGYPMQNRGHDNWIAHLPTSLLSSESFDYFIEVRDPGGKRSYVGSEDQPFHVHVVDAPVFPAIAEVSSVPGAMVSLDGKEIGPAPQKLDASEGRHTVAVVLPDGRGAEQSVDFVPGKSKKITIAPSGNGGPGRLDVLSDPRGARVYLDGAQVGLTPYSGDVLAGKHTLALELDGYIREERESEFHFGRDVELRFALKLLPKEPALSIESTPDRAEVYIDGAQKGTTPYLSPLKAGPHEVVLKQPGRGDAASNFEMPADRDLSLRLQLPETSRNAAPRLVIYSKPDGAALKIDGVDSGVTPWTGEVGEGKHKVAVGAEGYLSEEREVGAERNREADVSFLLQRKPGPARVTIETEPAEGVEVSIDGNVVGTTPIAQAISLEAGEHQVQASAATFRTLAQTITVEQGQSTALKLSLSVAPKEPLPPTIALNTEPTGARAYVDGKLVGETPVRVKSVPGPHELKLLLDGYIGRASKVTLPADSGFELRVAVGLKRVRGFEQVERPDPLLLARSQVTRALACYRLGDFNCALTAYRAAYEIKPIPDLLFNIAQTQRKLGQLKDAITAYKAFLAEKKTGAVAEVARAHLAECEAALAKGETKVADEAVAEAPPPPTLAHDPVTHAARGKDLRLTAVVKGSRGGLGTIQVCYRGPIGDYKCAPMSKTDTPDQYAAVIPGGSVSDGLAYYLEAYDADGGQHAQAGDKRVPASVVKMDDELPAAPPSSAVAAAPLTPAPQIAVIAAPPPRGERLPIAVPWATAGAGAASLIASGVFYANGKSAANELSSGAHPGSDVQTLEKRVGNDQTRANVCLGLGLALVVAAGALFFYDYH